VASIQLKSLRKTFGQALVVKDISLDVQDGEFLVLLGPSGCGKSTLLRMLAGLESVSGGEIHINDRRVDQLPPTDRDIAFVFQSYALYPHMTVRRNITFPLIMKQHRWWFHLPVIGGIAKRRIERSPEVADLVERTARTLALTDRLNQYPRTLSGGQRQRVALGRAMVRQPEVFLMDEPLSNLDAKLRSSMRAEISKLHQRVGGTFVYVTHDQVEAMTMGTRIALLKDGIVQQLGTPREIYENPANTYVARFIGTPPMNLLHAEVREGTLHIGDFSQALPSHARAALPSCFQGPVIVGVRPNRFAIAVDQPSSLGGTVSLIEHVGAESSVAVSLRTARSLHDEEGSAANEVMLVLPGYSALRAGQDVALFPDLSDAVLFSAESGQNLVPATATAPATTH
jgi:multiple sugar transport system ATP-binding protein